ncbi:hypothetical protein V6Z12_A13G194500 [Gossypium hirsutum]|uniref:Uncharacterized protein n=1 Tax=Gossypium tomentosum TaxID=34277 RepID=A0A5D2MMK4_GOSTO|nr:hypothetical protein ES332_A13G198500v1 [Gossypium tomentosum]
MPRPSTAPKVTCDQRSRALHRCEHGARCVSEHVSDVEWWCRANRGVVASGARCIC